MKQAIFSIATILTVFTACNNEGSTKTSATLKTTDSTVTTPTNSVVTTASPVNGIIEGYIHLKNALTADKGKDAAIAGNEILSAMNAIDTTKMNLAQKKSYTDVADDVKENAEHISTNATKIGHQREHFEMLSKDVYELVKAFGAGKTMYKDFCPMAFDQKGAFWLSETKEIKNPYFGTEMPECGELKEELK